VIYVHRADGDTWLQVLTSNRRRLRVQRTGRPDARGPVPVIAGTDQYAVDLALQRDAWIISLQAQAGALGVELLAASLEAHADLQRIAQLYARLDEVAEKLLAARQTVIYGPAALRDLPDPKKTKIELPHHGLWGSEYLLADGRDQATRYSVRDLPAYWRLLGLSPDIGSIRLEACCSGDVAPREHLISYPRGYYGPASAQHLAPAQMLADAMAQAGFTSPRVTGYQGIGICVVNYFSKNDVYISETWAEDVSLPEEPYAVRVGFDKKGARLSIARRSDVAMVFEPTDPNRSRKALRYDRAYLYAPRWEENAFEVALEENARRLAKWIDSGSVKPRGPIPLLARNAQEKETLSGIRRNRIRALARDVQAARDERRNCERALGDASLSGEARDEMQQKIDALDFTIKLRSFDMAAAEATDIDEWEALLTVPDAERKSAAEIEAMRTTQLAKTKLYLVPDGRTGSGFRAAELSRDLARPFLSAGVTPYIGSFRLLNNGSADVRRRRKSVANPPASSGSGSTPHLTPAQELANQLYEDGFLRPRVTGYQGQGVSWAASRSLVDADADAPGSSAGARHQGWGSHSIAPPHALRIVPGDASQSKRRSEVGKVFVPKRGLALAFPSS
jgi:hypothetical protein